MVWKRKLFVLDEPLTVYLLPRVNSGGSVGPEKSDSGLI